MLGRQKPGRQMLGVGIDRISEQEELHDREGDDQAQGHWIASNLDPFLVQHGKESPKGKPVHCSSAGERCYLPTRSPLPWALWLSRRALFQLKIICRMASAFTRMPRRTQQMNKDVLEPGLDLMPRQRGIAEIGDRPLKRGTVAAGDMDRSPKNSGRFDT